MLIVWSREGSLIGKHSCIGCVILPKGIDQTKAEHPVGSAGKISFKRFIGQHL